MVHKMKEQENKLIMTVLHTECMGWLGF